MYDKTNVRAYILEGAKVMRRITEIADKKHREIVVAQFGEGNFLRAFVDWMIDKANAQGVMDAGIAIIKPISYGSLEQFHAQNCTYTVALRGRSDGAIVDSRDIVTSVMTAVDCYTEYESYRALAALPSLRVVVSNTTEAGIVLDESDRFEYCPPQTYPGKLTKFLYERFLAFSGDVGKGLVILPVELIENNGGKLRDCVLALARLWQLPDTFAAWLAEGCIFCNTLVDRIVTGYPPDAQAVLGDCGYADALLVVGEPFALWVIESDRPDAVRAALPLDTAGLPVVFTDNLTPYRDRKVRLLNGAHTGMVLAAYLAGLDTVGECMVDTDMRAYLEALLFGEIAPMVNLPAQTVADFAHSVLERFENPFIRHELLSIALNSVSKWRARILPSLLENVARNAQPPRMLCFSFTALLAFYRSSTLRDGALIGCRDGVEYKILDDAAALQLFAANAGKADGDYVRAIAESVPLWGENLCAVAGFCDLVTAQLTAISKNGARAAMKEACSA